MRWRRIEAGVYEREDGQRRIIRTRWEGAGPACGTRWLWETASPDISGWCIDGFGGFWTLRDAKASVEAEEARA